jgi:site-specific DNA recombinase
MAFDGYVRISQVGGREGESFLSPKIQRDSIARQAKAKGVEIGELVEERDVTGGKAISQRELGCLVEKVERGESDGLIVWKVSRFSRNQLDGIQTAARIRAAGGHIIGEDLDTSAPMGRAMLGFLLGWAEEELDQRRAGWNEAQARAVARGVHVASRVPTGYRKRKDGRLEPDPAATKVIRSLFARRAAGAGWTELARFLDESGVRGPHGNKSWTPSAAQKMIRNPVYLGQARSGAHKNDDAHEPLLTHAEWAAAQGNGRGVASPRNGDGLLLAGLVRCSGCRYLVKADTMRDRDGSRLGIYRCRGRHAAGKCPAPATVMARLLDPYMETVFLEALGPDGPLAEATQATDAVDDAARLVKDAEHELDAYLASGLVSVVGQERFRAGAEQRQQELERARAELHAARQDSVFADTLNLTSGSLLEAWPSLNVPEKRHLLSASIDAVMIRAVRGLGRAVPIEERVLVLWRGQAPDDLPRRGRRQPLAAFPWPDEDPADPRVPAA